MTEALHYLYLNKERHLLCCIDVLCFELQLHVENVWKAVFVRLMTGKSWVKFIDVQAGRDWLWLRIEPLPHPNYSRVLCA